MVLDDKDTKVRSSWFHTDPKLFELPYVQEQIKRIWEEKFSNNPPPARAWAGAVKKTQRMLIDTRKEVTAIRRKRRENTFHELERLEACKDQTPLEREQTMQLCHKLHTEEIIESIHLKLFFKTWWVNKIDRPVKEMYRLLKNKTAQDMIPMLRKADGTLASSDQENLETAWLYYSQIFSVQESPYPDKGACQEEIRRVWESSVPSHQPGIPPLPRRNEQSNRLPKKSQEP